jgi:hypothetical protein
MDRNSSDKAIEDHATTNRRMESSDQQSRPSNEFVLVRTSRGEKVTTGMLSTTHMFASASDVFQNFAFLSFLVFTTVQFFFSSLARSDAMMTDCSGTLLLLPRIKSNHDSLSLTHAMFE